MDKLAFDAAVEHINTNIRAGFGSRMFEDLKREHGINFDAVAKQQGSPLFWSRPGLSLKNFDLAMDVQSELVSVSNAGVPAFMATWVDPKVIPILVSPMMAAIIAGETGKGDWTTEVTMFLTAEAAGETASYGDYSLVGQSNVNVNFPQRQNYLFQSFMQYGQREVEMAGLAKLDWVSLQQQANALTLMKALNFLYFYGVAGLQNYGLINDPSLYPSLTPTFSWLTSASATANTIYQDIVRLFIQLQSQSNGTVREDAPMVLAMSPTQAVTLKYITQYNTNSVMELLKENFPRLRLETAVQYQTPSGQLVQLICEELEGQRTLEAAFSSKLMAHMMVNESSSWKQKRSSGGYGTIWYRPFLCASMLG